MPEDIIPGGYILLSRKLLKSSIMAKPPLYLKIWVWLLLKASHQEHNGLKRGQLKTSIPEIQEAMSYKIGFRLEKPTYKQVRGVLDWLRNPDEGKDEGHSKGRMIVTTKVTHGMLIEVCNYGVYQDPKRYEGQTEGHDEIPTKEMRRARQGHNKDKNVYKNYNNKDIYNIVPKKAVKEIYESLSSDYRNLFERYLNIYRRKNTTGKITDNRHYRLLNEVYQILQDMSFTFNGRRYELTEDIFREGLELIINKGIDNLNYARKVWISRLEDKNKRSAGESSEQKPGSYDGMETNEEEIMAWMKEIGYNE